MPLLRKLRLPTGPLAASTALVTFWQLVRVSVQLLWTIVIARSLSAEGYGTFSGIAGLASMFGTFSGIGMGLLMLQQVSRRPDSFSLYWRKSWSVTIPLGSLLVLLFTWFGPSIFNGTKSPFTYAIIGLTELVFLPTTIICSYAFQARGRMGIANMLYVFVPVANLLAGVTFLASDCTRSLANYLWFHGAWSMLATSAAYFVVRGCLKPERTPISISADDMAEAAGFSLMRLADTGLSTLDKTLVLRLAGPEIAGAYTAAYRLVTVLALPVSALSMSALPRLFKEGERSNGGTTRFVGTLLKPTLVYGVFAGLMMWLVAAGLPLLLGDSFEPARDIARWLSPSPLLMGLCTLGSNVLLASERRSYRILAQCAGLVSMIIAASLLIPHYGLIGAAFTLLIAQGLTAALLWGLVARKAC